MVFLRELFSASLGSFSTHFNKSGIEVTTSIFLLYIFEEIIAFKPRKYPFKVDVTY